jgi:hypothetical protein
MSEKDKNESFMNPMNWRSLGFFSVEDYLVYIFKKTEKIASALYLVSSLLKDEEPIKWEIRDKGIDLLSSSFEASSSVPGDKNAVIQSLFTAALETLSLLNVAKISHLISEMNHRILVREIDNIVGMLKDKLAENAENAGYILSESFFRTPDLYVSGFKKDEYKGKNSSATSLGHKSNSGSNIAPGQGQSNTDGKKNERQTAIINLLKERPNLTIKDFTYVIRDCSEKTIQRELLDLISQGVVMKEGERRWSHYSLIKKS